MTTEHLHAVIMAGGSGTRFWPASRESRPKQFLPISGSRPMITETFLRLQGLVPTERVLVVTAASQAALVREALPELPPENILAEPMACNTAACVAWASYEVKKRDPEAVELVLPADHVIRPVEAFQDTVRAAAAEAEADPEALFVFGIKPTYPATGYGYIESGAERATRDGIQVFEVESFKEKPDEETAIEFLARGTFLWNSGMFVWRSSAIQAAFRTHLPAVTDGLARLDAGTPLEEVYSGFPRQPVDVAIIEKAETVRMLPIEYSWSDVGSWAALPDVHAADKNGNVRVFAAGAELVTHASTGCVAYAEDEELIALVDVQDLVVVRSGKTTLICPRAKAQNVKKIVEALKQARSPYA